MGEVYIFTRPAVAWQQVSVTKIVVTEDIERSGCCDVVTYARATAEVTVEQIQRWLLAEFRNYLNNNLAISNIFSRNFKMKNINSVKLT